MDLQTTISSNLIGVSAELNKSRRKTPTSPNDIKTATEWDDVFSHPEMEWL